MPMILLLHTAAAAASVPTSDISRRVALQQGIATATACSSLLNAAPASATLASAVSLPATTSVASLQTIGGTLPSIALPGGGNFFCAWRNFENGPCPLARALPLSRL